VVDEQLRAAGEEVGQGLRPGFGIERVVLLDRDPGQLAPPPGQVVPAARELLLVLQELVARRLPFLLRPDPVLGHRRYCLHARCTVRYSEPNGSVSNDRRPRFCSHRRPDPPRRPRTAGLRERDDQRARRALRHVAHRDEEAHPAARAGGARDDGEGRPRPPVHARAVRVRGHQHVAAAARPLRPCRGTNERRTMSTTTKKKSGGFSAEEKAAMRARAKELKAAEEGESAVVAALEKMTPSDRAIGERIHAIVKDAAPELTPKTWYGMPAYA